MPVYLAGYGYANVASVEQSQQEVLDTLNGPFSLHYYSKGVVQEARVFYLRPIVVTSSSKQSSNTSPVPISLRIQSYSRRRKSHFIVRIIQFSTMARGDKTSSSK